VPPQRTGDTSHTRVWIKFDQTRPNSQNFQKVIENEE
jgi:hypothetical protein